MSLFTILDTLLIGPLKLTFELIFAFSYNFIDHPGYTIIAFSLVMNILVLPLYRRADAMQEQARDVEEKLSKGVDHIKKAFSGDERMMILQTYYRQNNYKPTDALRGSVSLLLEIPFFMAAYQFLSHLDILVGASLGPITDLSQPDALLVIGGLTLNLLPILMTLINVISSAIYLKGFPMKTKVQLYGMALFFLVFLYNSPSGLVFYWTLNNLFNLVKTIFYKLKNPRPILRVLCSMAGIALFLLSSAYLDISTVKKKILIFALVFLLQVPLFFPLLLRLFPRLLDSLTATPSKKVFLFSSLFLTVLTGLLIPSTFIAASPQEFTDINYFYHPLWYLVSSGCLAVGFFLIWLRVFYWLAGDSAKAFFERIVWVLCGVMLVNYMFFGTDLGLISPALQYENGVWFSVKDQLLNLLVLVVLALVLYIVAVRYRRGVLIALLATIIALSGMSVLNASTICKSIRNLDQESASSIPTFQLSKNGKNVVILMLDRAAGEFIPYIFNEKPELKEQFDGFTYYSNVISHGSFTNFGTPGLYGGYEYTPVEMNKRSDEALVDKHNEALKVLPVLFRENDYEVTVCDPVYANYQWIPDLSAFDDYPEIKAFNTKGAFTDEVQKEMFIAHNQRNFFVFSIMKTMPLLAQRVIYDNGLYLRLASYADEAEAYTIQIQSTPSRAEGIDVGFMESYNVLANMSLITEVTEACTDTFLFMSNDMTHEPMLLQEPDYVPVWSVDNTAYDTANADRFTLDGRTLLIGSVGQFSHYQTNMAAMVLLGRWFDYLRENDVYDNTRIILVADHGGVTSFLEELVFQKAGHHTESVERFFPLLLVKDFNSSGFTTSGEFMTNADVPTLAVKDIIEDPINPFTGIKISSKEKQAHEQFITLSWDHNIYSNNGNTFTPSKWASVKDDLWEEDNWIFYEGEHVLTEHKAP